MNFLHKKLVDNMKYYPNMQFQPKVMTPSQENGQKKQFFEKLLVKELSFPGKSSSVTSLHL